MPENVTPLPEDPELTRLRAALAEKDAELERWEKRWETLRVSIEGSLQVGRPSDYLDGILYANKAILKMMDRLTPAPNSGDAAGE